MRYLKIDEEEFWENPPRLKKIGFPGVVLKRDDEVVIDEADRPFRSRSSYFVLGDPGDDEAPTGIVLKMPPGYALPYHSHPCDIFMLVLRGSLYVPGAVLRPGDGLTAKAHEFYGPEVAGADGCTRVEFFGTLEGATTVEYELPDGERRSWSALHDGQSPWRTGMERFPELLGQVLADLRADASASPK
jgi:hypothetical protein